MTPEQRKQRASIAAYASWGRTRDRAARTSAARTGLMAKFEQQARENLGEQATDHDVALAAESLRSAHYRQLAAKSARARAARRAVSEAVA